MVPAVAGWQCVVCDRHFSAGKAWKHTAGMICAECMQLPRRCSLCGLPVRDGFVQTGDGRIICRREADDVVLKESEAVKLFRRVQREVGWLAEGRIRLRFPEVQVRLYDVDYWNNNDNRTDNHPREDSMRRSGLAQTRRSGRVFRHTILLLSGLPEDELLGVCAHELTHCWINENLPAGRRLQANTVEAICELVAYQYLHGKRMTDQTDRIRANPYTRGKIEEAVALARKFGFFNVLDWVRKGTGAELHAAAMREFVADTTKFASLPADPAGDRRNSPPRRLELQGILGSRIRPLALINGRSFAEGESASVPVGEHKVPLTCLEIAADRVKVRTGNENTPLVLKIGAD